MEYVGLPNWEIDGGFMVPKGRTTRGSAVHIMAALTSA